jgi:predicted nucleic acid-binding protein
LVRQAKQRAGQQGCSLKDLVARTVAVPACLLDGNVWLAAAFPAHPAHANCQKVLLEATPGSPALFCRATQQSFLRLVSTPAIFNAYRSDPITDRDALSALAAFAALPQVGLIEDVEQFLGAQLDLVLLQVDAGSGEGGTDF